MSKELFDAVADPDTQLCVFAGKLYVANPWHPVRVLTADGLVPLRQPSGDEIQSGTYPSVSALFPRLHPAATQPKG